MVYGKGNSNNHSNPKDQCFLTWRNMLKRCYSSEQKYKNYKEQEIVVCDEWLDFLTFKSWYDRNFYRVDNEEMNLDKDILCHGNKMYCPEYCINQYKGKIPQRLYEAMIMFEVKIDD